MARIVLAEIIMTGLFTIPSNTQLVFKMSKTTLMIKYNCMTINLDLRDINRKHLIKGLSMITGHKPNYRDIRLVLPLLDKYMELHASMSEDTLIDYRVSTDNNNQCSFNMNAKGSFNFMLQNELINMFNNL